MEFICQHDSFSLVLPIRHNRHCIVSQPCNYYTLLSLLGVKASGRWVVGKQKHTPTSCFAVFHIISVWWLIMQRAQYLQLMFTSNIRMGRNVISLAAITCMYFVFGVEILTFGDFSLTLWIGWTGSSPEMMYATYSLYQFMKRFQLTLTKWLRRFRPIIYTIFDHLIQCLFILMLQSVWVLFWPTPISLSLWFSMQPQRCHKAKMTSNWLQNPV